MEKFHEYLQNVDCRCDKYCLCDKCCPLLKQEEAVFKDFAHKKWMPSATEPEVMAQLAYEIYQLQVCMEGIIDDIRI